MYLVAIHVPIFLDGDRPLIATDWLRSLRLLRDSFSGRFGPITVVAPSLSTSHPSAEQKLEAPAPDEDIVLEPSFDFSGRCRDFWLRDRKQWIADVDRLLPNAQVVHAGLDDVFRPVSYSGHARAVAANKPTVFVQDVDISLRARQLATTPVAAIKANLYALHYERLARKGVQAADLSLLKGRSIMRRFASTARNPHTFHDTSYLSSEIVPADVVERRHARPADSPFRLVYCGRIARAKGVFESVDIIARARRLGRDIRFDMIGDGEDRAAIEKIISEQNLDSYIRCLGPQAYGPELIRKLAEWDALLFTPPGEETPRMIFDGFAAGLPLVAFAIEYVVERADEDAAACLLPNDNPQQAAQLINDLAADREKIAKLTRAAHQAAHKHAADVWYQRRAQWTIEAVEKRIGAAKTTVKLSAA